MRRNVSASDLDVAAVDGPPIAADEQDAGADDDGADSDDDVDDERASKGRTRNHDGPLVPGRACDLRDRSVAAMRSAGVARDDDNSNGGDGSDGDAVEKDRADDDDAGTARDDSKNDHDDGRGNVKDDGDDDAAGVACDGNNNDDDDDDDNDDDRAEGDEDGDDSGSEDDEPLPENLEALRRLCDVHGLSPHGTRRTLQSRPRSHASRSEDAAAVDSATAGVPPSRARSRKQTKREENQQRLIHAVECATRSTGENISGDGLVKKLRHFARQLNDWVHRQSRERTGSRNRFVETDIRNGTRETRADYAIDVSDALNFTRLCKRLRGGDSLANCRRMARALGLSTSGDVSALRSKIELRLRDVEFEKNMEFLPLHEHASLGHDDFNDLCEEDGPYENVVHYISSIERVLQGLQHPDQAPRPRASASAVCNCGPGGGPMAGAGSHNGFCSVFSSPQLVVPPSAENQPSSAKSQPAQPPSSPPRLHRLDETPNSAARAGTTNASAHDVEANVDAVSLSPGSREVRYVLDTALKPSMLTDQVLIEETGAYHEDVIQVMFKQTALDFQTEVKGTAVAQKLSEVNEDKRHRFTPEDLLYLGNKLKFDRKFVSFPITVTVHTKTVTNSAGLRHARSTTDFHFSAAVYDVDRNQLFHADSLSYTSHEWVVRNELAKWIRLCVSKSTGKTISAPEYIHVPCTQQGPTMNCGPASIVNNRLIIRALSNGSQGRVKVNRFITYPPTQFKEHRRNLKAELMALVDKAL